jgi:predicted nucleic-acid-binding Zn-ribbon protein
MKPASCPNCGGQNQYASRPVSAGGGYAPNYLPGLGGLIGSGKFQLVCCEDCGLTRFFARAEATAKLRDSSKWTRL